MTSLNDTYQLFEETILRANIRYLLKATHIIACLREKTHYVHQPAALTNLSYLNLAEEYRKTLEYTIKYLSNKLGEDPINEEDHLINAFHQLVLLEQLETDL
ncbi:hypothetical protein [Flavihumibacter sp.]|uniref:hypothetical protein n=1 Tax=Flavihumibacter sp. TaxID=1913981 RepID=UPI002FC93E5E